MYALELDRRFDHGGPREARPFEDADLALRFAPFISLLLVTLAVVSIAYDGITAEITLCWALVALIVGAAFLLPWSRLPASYQAIPVLLLYVVAALVRDATGGGASVFTALILLPVVWFALYGTLNQVLLSILGCALAIGLPVVLDSGSRYPSSELGRAALDSIMTGALGVTGLHLMRKI